MTPAFTLLSAATGPGGTINEDAYGLWPAAGAPRAAWVQDGVTGINDRALLPGPSDAAWFVAQVQEVLPALLSKEPDRPIAGLVAALVVELERRQAASWLDERGADGQETPAASFALVRLLGEQVEIDRLGDCLVLIERRDGSVTTLDHPVLEQIEAQIKAAVMALQAAGITDPGEIRSRMMPTLRAQRVRRNQVGGYGVLAAEMSCLTMLHSDLLALADVSRILLASDGYYRLVDHYAAVTDAELLRGTAERGAEGLVSALRTIEAGDPMGARFPRLKMSDDATAVLLQAP